MVLRAVALAVLLASIKTTLRLTLARLLPPGPDWTGFVLIVAQHGLEWLGPVIYCSLVIVLSLRVGCGPESNIVALAVLLASNKTTLRLALARLLPPGPDWTGFVLIVSGTAWTGVA